MIYFFNFISKMDSIFYFFFRFMFCYVATDSVLLCIIEVVCPDAAQRELTSGVPYLEIYSILN